MARTVFLHRCISLTARQGGRDPVEFAGKPHRCPRVAQAEHIQSCCSHCDRSLRWRCVESRPFWRASPLTAGARPTLARVGRRLCARRDRCLSIRSTSSNNISSSDHSSSSIRDHSNSDHSNSNSNSKSSSDRISIMSPAAAAMAATDTRTTSTTSIWTAIWCFLSNQCPCNAKCSRPGLISASTDRCATLFVCVNLSFKYPAFVSRIAMFPSFVAESICIILSLPPFSCRDSALSRNASPIFV